MMSNGELQEGSFSKEQYQGICNFIFKQTVI